MELSQTCTNAVYMGTLGMSQWAFRAGVCARWDSLRLIGPRPEQTPEASREAAECFKMAAQLSGGFTKKVMLQNAAQCLLEASSLSAQAGGA